MSEIKTNFRVVASLNPHHYRFRTARRTWEAQEQDTKELLAQIKRHADVDDAYLAWDTECEHCGRSWEVDEHGEPVCCDEAQVEWKATQEAKHEA